MICPKGTPKFTMRLSMPNFLSQVSILLAKAAEEEAVPAEEAAEPEAAEEVAEEPEATEEVAEEPEAAEEAWLRSGGTVGTEDRPGTAAARYGTALEKAGQSPAIEDRGRCTAPCQCAWRL